jgi:hypothetical protein
MPLPWGVASERGCSGFKEPAAFAAGRLVVTLRPPVSAERLPRLEKDGNETHDGRNGRSELGC